MEKLEMVLATRNAGKAAELQGLLRARYGAKITLLTLSEIGFEGDIEETGQTFAENALLKARAAAAASGKIGLGDDSGLVVPALGGAPGIYSARYAGEPADFAKNRAKLLAALAGISNRRAQFRTVVSLILNDKTYFFEGIVTGRIIAEERGVGGFGYDSVFVPDGYDKTFAELPAAVKNSISHRARAMEQLNNFLTQHP